MKANFKKPSTWLLLSSVLLANTVEAAGVDKAKITLEKIRGELATKTIRNFIEKTVRLYEQNACNERISRYVKRWVKKRIIQKAFGLSNGFTIYKKRKIYEKS